MTAFEETDTLRLCLPLPPRNNVYYRHGNNRTYLSDDAKVFKQLVWAEALKQKLKPDNADYEIKITIHNRLTKKGMASKVCADVDAYFKAIMDAFQGCVYYDDKQVKKISAEYGMPIIGGGITIEISMLNKRECNGE